ncbi:nucleoside recognition GATE domain-containing membrane protein YjiH [Haladaptatus litoreus]|uniref:Nucleoside recognition GATE domain-containing membrane protein YjiH n=1 Tax=Haladaptatus litoreus TaxID=553468 RepID=A0A1N7CN38_9EURY|nr:YjiH family protein [Haladaptatus litoreus]SIR64970.1 nucleoside recognition GATE domain-containing membrane protein YjiH [Haladaptatus litoreus]
MSSEENSLYTINAEHSQRSIDDIDLEDFAIQPVVKFVVAFLIGGVFFLLPVPYQGEITVPFDIAVSFLTETFPTAVGVYSLAIIVAGGVLTTFAMLGDGTFAGYNLSYFETSNVFWGLRLAGLVLAPIMFFKLGPEILHTPGTGGLMWGSLVYSVGVIIPLGAVFITIFVALGGLEFVGTLARPIMKPLFKVPGRAALDSLASWVGSYSVGLYVTRNVFENGGYHKRDVFTIATCFSTVSIGFVGIVAATLELLHLFPLIFSAYFLCVIITAIILVRLPPIATTPDEYIAEPDPELPFTGSISDYLRLAINEATTKARDGDSFAHAAKRGFIDGVKLTALILGTILAVGLAATLLSANTPVFDILGKPLVPIIAALGIPNAEAVAPATIVGITEMYVPVLLVTETATKAKFFVAVLAVSQLIFFSSVGPMILDMFSDVPIQLRDLVTLFVMRTMILVPLIAGMTHLFAAFGML